MGSNPTRATFIGGVAQTARALACQARGRRFEPGRPRCGRRIEANTPGRDPGDAGSSPAGHPSSGREASESSPACNANASGCGGSTPPVRTSLGDEAQPGERLACTEEDRVRLPASPLLRWAAARRVRLGPTSSRPAGTATSHGSVCSRSPGSRQRRSCQPCRQS